MHRFRHLEEGWFAMVIETLLHPENHDKRYEALFLDIDQGRTKIPLFQREFVWDKAQSAKLIDSVLKGYPIGTFIFWKTREELRSYREIGNHSLPQIPKGDYAECFGWTAADYVALRNT
jgi:hypothetical protein